MLRAREPHAAADLAAHALAYADALYNLARYLARSEADAEDLVQETYARAFSAAGRLGTGSNLKAYMFRILRNAFLSRWRHERHEAPDADPAADLDGRADGAPEALRGDAELEAIRRIEGKELQEALRHLGEDARTAVLLDLEGFSEAEMAGILECANGTVKSRLSRARAELRRRMAGDGRRERP